MTPNEITEIIEKHNREEAFLDNQLEQKKLNTQDAVKTIPYANQIDNLTLAAAKQRNNEILKELELVKGKLRSKSIFSPTEINWDAICRRYQEAPALPITLWRCHTCS